MARSRQINVESRIIGEARRLWLGGVSRQESVDILRAMFPGVYPSQIAAWVDWTRESAENAAKLDAANKRLFAKPAKIAGCLDQNARVRVHITIHFIDPRTGMPGRFHDIADLSGRGTLGNQLFQAIDHVRTLALSRAYQIASMGYDSTSGYPRYEINYAECIS